MPFCTSCGKEVTPGKKFCEYCGTPLDQHAAPAEPANPPLVPSPLVTSQTVPVKPSGGSIKTMVIAGIIVILVIVAGVYFIGLPLISGSPATAPVVQHSTPLPTQALTQFPTTLIMATTGAPGTLDSSVSRQTYEEKYMETYNQVYSFNHAFIGGQKEVFTQDTSIPPLYIKYNITPKMFFGEKTVDIGLPSEHLVNLSYISPNAWFKVRVYDVGNGVLVEEQGFNKEHSVMTKQEFMVRSPGNYRVEMSGNDVIAEVRILTGKS
jgi:heme/copper-type cytochrome/quinol oxidase subunit 2